MLEIEPSPPVEPATIYCYFHPRSRVAANQQAQDMRETLPETKIVPISRAVVPVGMVVFNAKPLSQSELALVVSDPDLP